MLHLLKTLLFLGHILKIPDYKSCTPSSNARAWTFFPSTVFAMTTTDRQNLYTSHSPLKAVPVRPCPACGPGHPILPQHAAFTNKSCNDISPQITFSPPHTGLVRPRPACGPGHPILPQHAAAPSQASSSAKTWEGDWQGQSPSSHQGQTSEICVQAFLLHWIEAATWY